MHLLTSSQEMLPNWKNESTSLYLLNISVGMIFHGKYIKQIFYLYHQRCDRALDGEEPMQIIMELTFSVC